MRSRAAMRPVWLAVVWVAAMVAGCSGGDDEAPADAQQLHRSSPARVAEARFEPRPSLQSGVFLLGGTPGEPSSPQHGYDTNDVFFSKDLERWQLVSPHRTGRDKWSPRCPHVVFHRARYWVVGGHTSCYDFGLEELDDVWSSEDGVAWTRVLARGAPFRGNVGMQVVAFSGRIWALGGIDASGPQGPATAWSSEDGVQWQAHPLPYRPRAGAAVGVIGGTLHVIGGVDRSNGPNGTVYAEHWTSTDGISWTQAPPPPPGAVHGAKLVPFQGRLFLLGGAVPIGFGAEAPSQAVWSFGPGLRWHFGGDNLPLPAAPSAAPEWSTRADFVDAVVANGRIWFVRYAHGVGAENRLYASRDGTAWTEMPTAPSWSQRTNVRLVASAPPQIAAGARSTCAVDPAGKVSCWGDNGAWQLGNAAVPQSAVPIPVAGLAAPATALSVGAAHACALLDTGGVQCWGANDRGQLGLGGVSQPVAQPSTPLGLGDGVVSISAGTDATCAVSRDGTLRCWGAGPMTGGAAPASMSSLPVPTVVPGHGPGSTVSVSVGHETACAVVAPFGGIRCWGSNAFGQLGDGSSVGQSTAPVDVYGILGAEHVSIRGATACSRSGMGPHCWGDGRHGNLGDGYGSSWSAVPVAVMGYGHPVASVSAGTDHACFLRPQGVAFCWGANWVAGSPSALFGQLGIGPGYALVDQPYPVAGLPETLQSLSSGGHHTCALTDSGRAMCWGSNLHGQLGDGSTASAWLPTFVR